MRALIAAALLAVVFTLFWISSGFPDLW